MPTTQVREDLASIAAERHSFAALEKAILALMILLLVVAAILVGTVLQVARNQGVIRDEQRAGIVRGYKNRAVACATLGAQAARVPACQEPQVLEFYRAP